MKNTRIIPGASLAGHMPSTHQHDTSPAHWVVASQEPCSRNQPTGHTPAQWVGQQLSPRNSRSTPHAGPIGTRLPAMLTAPPYRTSKLGPKGRATHTPEASEAIHTQEEPKGSTGCPTVQTDQPQTTLGAKIQRGDPRGHQTRNPSRLLLRRDART